MGSALTIDLDTNEVVKSGDEVNVQIEYNTTPECTAIGWLEKEYVTRTSATAVTRSVFHLRQTAGQKFDFLFSQCQPVSSPTFLRLPTTEQPYRSTQDPLRHFKTHHQSRLYVDHHTSKLPRFTYLPQTYSASVRSILPTLMSALRVSPPSETVHDGKKVGEDIVEYKYNQVR